MGQYASAEGMEKGPRPALHRPRPYGSVGDLCSGR
jgi:hypothetical protein